MENKNSNLSIIFKELIQCALLLAYIVSMNFMTKPLYLAIPAVLGIIIVKLSESSIRQQYKVLKIENDEEEEKVQHQGSVTDVISALNDLVGVRVIATHREMEQNKEPMIYLDDFKPEEVEG